MATADDLRHLSVKFMRSSKSIMKRICELAQCRGIAYRVGVGFGVAIRL